MSSRRRSTFVSVGLLLLIALLVALVLPLGARAADKIKDLVQIGNTPDNPVPVAQAGRWSVDVGAPTVKLDPAGNGVKVLNGDANSIPVHLASKKEPFSTIVDVAIEDGHSWGLGEYTAPSDRYLVIKTVSFATVLPIGVNVARATVSSPSSYGMGEYFLTGFQTLANDPRIDWSADNQLEFAVAPGQTIHFLWQRNGSTTGEIHGAFNLAGYVTDAL